MLMDQALYQPPSVDEMGDHFAPATPMMAQYLEIKAVNPGYLLFYRMGDFYELFFGDAEIASRALGIVLTKRGQHQGADIPMCGVPVRAADEYLRKLIGMGHKVAICEQIEDPAEAKKRGAKSVVSRDVVRLVTPGTLTEDELLSPQANNFLASLALIQHGEADFGLAWVDISTGENYVAAVHGAAIGDLLARVEPAELILGEQTFAALKDLGGVLPTELGAHLTLLAAEYFDSEAANARIEAEFAGFDGAALTRVMRSALGGLVQYVAETQKGAGLSFRAPVIETDNTSMIIDPATRLSLELLTTNRGEAKGSLRSAIDLTVTSGGSRLLARRLSAPSTEIDVINARLDMVAEAAEDSNLTGAVRQRLKTVPDLVRALTRIILKRGGPRDLAAIGGAIIGAHALADLLDDEAMASDGYRTIGAALKALPVALGDEIRAGIDEEPPLLARDGGFVREGYDAELDRQRALASESRSVIAALQGELAEAAGIKSLKIKHNNVLGYFIEVPAAHGAKLMEGEGFVHRQSMANAMRFTNAELAGLEGKIAHAHEAALAAEGAIFERLTAKAMAEGEKLQAAASALAELDLSVALGTLAFERSYVRPRIDQSLEFSVRAGRHPVVERLLEGGAASFVVNDCNLGGSGDGAGAIWIVTGPNMGGKSTFLRQNALIAILGQAGSFVPAEAAHIGVVDRIFSRVGASDDIAHGRSTFMVEMVETAAILNRATSRSFVILDEIGRGTATFDGLSIAWATAEALHEANKCRTLFATHFHELGRLTETLPRVSLHNMKVREWNEEVVFLHEVTEGAADRSYGIQVARLAGLPAPVVERARAILDILEQQPSGLAGGALDDLPLFRARPVPQKKRDLLIEFIDGVRPDELTPRVAIDLFYQLKKLRDDTRGT